MSIKLAYFPVQTSFSNKKTSDIPTPTQIGNTYLCPNALLNYTDNKKVRIMITPDFTNINLDKLVTHHIGNKLLEEGILLSEQATDIERSTGDYLLKYFLTAFKPEEFYHFSHPADISMNEIYTITQRIFADKTRFIQDSQQIARLLYEHSTHPKIKEGELNIALFSDAILGDETVEAIGIFKSENNVPFIKMDSSLENYSIHHDFGFELKGIDKGCIIFNSGEESGFRLLIVDHTNRSAEAVYWKDDFLQVTPVSNEYFQTNQFLGITKNFVVKKLSEEFEVSKADKIDLLNRSVEYFKAHGNFDKTQFENEVFQQDEIINSFRSFNDNWLSDNQTESLDSFEISPQAVKKQARAFKSVLKLDKNFHIYIHGDKDLIERGTEADGRKYYKIYYHTES
jgi:hypothetical protein